MVTLQADVLSALMDAAVHGAKDWSDLAYDAIADNDADMTAEYQASADAAWRAIEFVRTMDVKTVSDMN
jgi:hypothetical protein